MPRPALNAPNRLVNDPLVKPLKPGAGHASLAVQAYEAIRAILFRGLYQQGESLRMEELCERLGTSKQPIADALKRLAHEGYLTIVPKVGCSVRIYSYESVRDYYQLYAASESLLAELAATRVTNRQLNGLVKVSDSIGQLVTAPRPGRSEAVRYRQLNRDFHARLRDAADSWLVAEAAAAMHDRSDFFTVTMQHAIRADRVQRGHAEHEAVIEALRRRDPAAARRAMEEHILGVCSRLWEPNDRRS